MEPEGSLPHSQVPITCPYPEPDQSCPFLTSYILKIQLNIILSSELGSSTWYVSIIFPHRNPKPLGLFLHIWTLALFRRNVISLYTVTSSCIPNSRHDHVLSFIAFTSSPISLLAITIVSVFFLIICMLPTNTITSSAWTKSLCVPFNCKPSSFTWTLLMAYSKAKFKSSCDTASPCFRPFLIRNMSDKNFLLGLCYMFHSDTFLLVLPVSRGYQTHWEYYTRPPSQLNYRLSGIL